MNHIGQLLRYAWPSMLLTLVLPLPGILFFAGQVDAMLCEWIDKGYLPAATAGSMRREILYRTKRNTYSLLLAVAGVLLCGALAFAFVRLGIGFWWYVGAASLLVLLMLPLEVCFMELSYTRKPLGECLRGYVLGWRNYGTLFVFELVGLIFLCFAQCLGAMPAITISTVIQQAMQARSMGDAIDLPLLFPVVAFGAYAIMVFVVLLAMLIYSFCHCLLWGCIMAREDGKKQQEEAFQSSIGSIVS